MSQSGHRNGHGSPHNPGHGYSCETYKRIEHPIDSSQLLFGCQRLSSNCESVRNNLSCKLTIPKCWLFGNTIKSLSWVFVDNSCPHQHYWLTFLHLRLRHTCGRSQSLSQGVWEQASLQVLAHLSCLQPLIHFICICPLCGKKHSSSQLLLHVILWLHL